MGGRDCCAPWYLRPIKGITGILDYYIFWNQAFFRINKPWFLMMDIILNLPRSRSSGMNSSPPHLGDFHIDK